MAMEQTRATLRPTEHTVVALVRDLDAVVLAVRRLHEAGFGHDQISILAKDEKACKQAALDSDVLNGDELVLPDDVADAVEPKGRDEMAGMAIGGAVGFLVGLTAVAIPGFGAFLLAAGPLAIALHSLTVSAAGMGLGALLGAILDERVTEEHKDLYRKRLEEGWWMVLVHAEDAQLEEATGVLRSSGVADVETI